MDFEYHVKPDRKDNFIIKIYVSATSHKEADQKLKEIIAPYKEAKVISVRKK